MESSEVVSVSMATMPWRFAATIQPLSAFSSWTSSYFTSAGGCVASAAASPEPPGAAPKRLSILGISDLKFCSSRKARTVAGSGSLTAKDSSGSGTGTSVQSVTSLRETRASSACSMRFSRRLGCLISSARASSESRSPYSVMSWAAVLTPMPATPGTLSDESPARAWTSMTLSGATPNFSLTSSTPMTRFFMASNMLMPSPTSCIRSLSEDTMVTSAPLARAWRA